MEVSKCTVLTDLDHELLRLAEMYGYKALAVSVHDPYVANSKWWSEKGSSVEFLCGEPDISSKRKGRDKEGNTATREIADKLKISAGCSNSNQTQLIRHGLSRVSYRKNEGKWFVYGVKNHLLLKSLDKLDTLGIYFGANVENCQRRLTKILEVINSYREEVMSLGMTPENYFPKRARNRARYSTVEETIKWSMEILKKNHLHTTIDPERITFSDLQHMKDLLTKSERYETFGV